MNRWLIKVQNTHIFTLWHGFQSYKGPEKHKSMHSLDCVSKMSSSNSLSWQQLYGICFLVISHPEELVLVSGINQSFRMITTHVINVFKKVSIDKVRSSDWLTNFSSQWQTDYETKVLNKLLEIILCTIRCLHVVVLMLMLVRTVSWS